MKHSRLSFLVLLLTLCSCHPRTDYLAQVASPDTHVTATCYLDSCGSPYIRLHVDDKEVLTVNHIGLTTNDSVNLTAGFRFDGFNRTKSNHHEDLLWGENKQIKLRDNGAIVQLTRDDGTNMDICIIVADDGFAFRYRYHNIDSTLLTGESTTYQFATDGICWSIPANFESYEMAYRQQPISQTTDANTPFTFVTADSLWGAIHEADLRNMPEMTLVRDSLDSLCFHTWLCPDNTGSGTVAHYGSGQSTSWRTLTIGHKAVDLINSTFSLSLNSSRHTQRLSDDELSFAKPIKYIGIWWGMHLGINSWTPDRRHGATTENALRYIDFAAANNIDAVLFEGWNLGWEQWGGTQVFDFVKAAPDFDVERVIAYAKGKGVQLIMHHETGGNIPHYEEEMEQAFQWCEDHDIHYVKTGYAGGFPNRHLHHSQYGVNHYQKVVECAARHHIALIVHEPIKPTGLRFTHPNLMSAEGARGMEWNAWSDGNSPAHETILPFTRLLAGPMDYTPGIFDITYESIKHNPNCKKWNMKDARECRVNTTIAKQVALWVVLYSPVVMASDLIENYQLEHPDGSTTIHPMFQFFRKYNPDCDWSQALQGQPGEYVVIARRAGTTYYLGAVTNEEARNITVPLDFLPQGTKYTAVIYGDAESTDYQTNPTSYRIWEEPVSHKSILQLHLATSGGAAVIIQPQDAALRTPSQR